MNPELGFHGLGESINNHIKAIIAVEASLIAALLASLAAAPLTEKLYSQITPLHAPPPLPLVEFGIASFEMGYYALQSEVRQMFFSGERLRSIDHIPVNSGIKTVILNYTKRDVNKEAVTGLYNYVDSLADQLIPVPYETGRDETILLTKRQDLKTRIIYLLPEDAPKLEWEVPGPVAATMFNPNWIKTKTYVRLGNREGLQPILDEATLGLAIEACQGTFEATTPGWPEGSIIDAQEFGCNAVGYGMAAKIQGLLHPDYRKAMNDPSRIATPRMTKDGILLALAKSVYDKIPLHLPVIN